jgi:hypothetical protein
MIEDLGHWRYSGEIPDDTFGFIYRITNITTNKIYVGKKQMQSRRKLKPLKGKKRKRIKQVESDWKKYTGSCSTLNEDIEELGMDNFKFDILFLCESKWELAYIEAKHQFENDVLLSENYYNGIINCRIGKAPKSFMEKE